TDTLAAEAKNVFEPVHWAYSSFFGTGWYQVEDTRSVFVVRVPIRQTLRTSSLTESGSRKLGVEIRYPVTVGLHDIEDLGGIIENDNFATASLTPGVELEIPINPRWYLRTLAHVGWGSDLRNDDSAWIYYAGIKSRYTFPARKYQWSLLAGLFYAGYTPDEGRSDHLAVAQVGTELRQPLNKVTFHGEPVDLHWTFMYSFLGNELHFNLPDGTFDPIQDQVEFGIQLSLRNRPFKFWFFDIHRLGVGYQFSTSGQFTAITLSMNSWFRK
ncbi:MAG: hypothetical protein QNK19_10735, partial [Xanthomonadales bacterium]|nr:hypothetical protein [Xanthomonadales bacterium]